MMANLASRHCTPVKKGTNPISADVAKSLLNTLRSGWLVDPNAKTIEREFRFRNFAEATGFVNAIAWIANTENHHPDLHIHNSRCKVTYSTREVGGLTVNDFICAAKIDALLKLEATGKSNLAQKVEAPAKPVANQSTVKTANSTDKSLKLNMAEAEALLSATDPEPTSTAETPAYDEDEITLFDPDETGAAEDEDIAAIATNGHTPTIQEKLANSTLEGPEIDVMSTLILPPEADGYIPTEPKNEKPKDNIQHIDVSSTVILPPGMEVSDEEINNIEHAKTMILPPQPTPDEIKTMVLQQDQIDHLDLEKNITDKPPRPSEEEVPTQEDQQYMRTIMMPPVVIDDKKSEND